MRFNVIASQLAVLVLLSPLLAINPSWAKPATETQINSYIQQLKNPQQRSTAVNYLASLGKPAVPALITAVQDSDPQVRASAIMILGQMGPNAAQAIPQLMRAIDDQDPSVRSQAVNAISKIGKEAYIPYLIAALESPKEWERYSAIHGLRAMGKDAASAVPVLLKKLEDEDMWMRVNAASALGSIGQAAASAMPALVTLLQDNDETVRYAAAYSLGAIASRLQENQNQLSNSQLNTTISHLEKALKILQNPSLKFRERAITSVNEPLSLLKKERMRR